MTCPACIGHACCCGAEDEPRARRSVATVRAPLSDADLDALRFQARRLRSGSATPGEVNQAAAMLTQAAGEIARLRADATSAAEAVRERCASAAAAYYDRTAANDIARIIRALPTEPDPPQQEERCACGAVWPAGRLSIGSAFPLHCPSCRPDLWGTAIMMLDPKPLRIEPTEPR